MKQPKYSLKEIERRWLVDVAMIGAYKDAPYLDIEDLYLSETLLRLRKVTDHDGRVTYKFCKKYGKIGALSNAITNIYLSDAEYLVLSKLDGIRVCKRRHAIADGVIDVYQGSSSLTVFEIEFDAESSAVVYTPPAFVGEEITNHPAYSGLALALRFSR